MESLPVATQYTYDFVKEQLPPAARHVLEIGCGNGEFAARLMEDGLSVVAIDSDAQCVAEALGRGVDARLLAWPRPLDRRFDCVLFTRSLHHVGDLRMSVRAARDALRPAGRLIVEDFHAEGPSDRSSEWYAGLVGVLSATGALAEGSDPDERLEAARPDDGHPLHSCRAIERALGEFGHLESRGAAYFFRYLEGHLRQPELAGQLLQWELGLIDAGAIDALGKRFVVSG